MADGQFGGGPVPSSFLGNLGQQQQAGQMSLLDMMQAQAPVPSGQGNVGGIDFGGLNQEPYFPADWRQQPNTYFSWADRGQQFDEMERRSYASGGKDQDATAFLAKTPRPETAYMSGADAPSTNDWRVLPSAYRRPGFIMVNGRIINTALSDPRSYLESLGVQGNPGQYKMSKGVGIGMPISLNDLSIGGQKGIWPGDVLGRESFTNPSYPTT